MVSIDGSLHCSHVTAVGVKRGDDAQWDNSDSATLEKLKTLTVYGLARAYGYGGRLWRVDGSVLHGVKSCFYGIIRADLVFRGLGMVASASRACSMTLSRQLEHNVDPLEEEKDAPVSWSQ